MLLMPQPRKKAPSPEGEGGLGAFYICALNREDSL